MRTTLAGGLIDVLRTNLARKQERVRIFEAGRCFLRARAGLRPAAAARRARLRRRVARAVGRSEAGPSTSSTSRATSTRWWRRERSTTERAEHPLLHPGARRACSWTAAESAGWASCTRGSCKEFELPRAPILFELDLAPLLARPLAGRASRCRGSRWSGATWRSSSTTSVPAQDVLAALDAAKPAHVESIRLFDVYRGRGIDPGKKSLAILVLMQDTERTLTDVEIDATMADLLRVLVVRFGATLRQ